MHQRRKLTLCLVAGVLVLAVSAAAAFGSVNGYDRYKQAVKQLLTQEENLTLQAQVNLAMDGAEVFAWQGTYAKDGADSARTSCTHSGEGEAYREFSTVRDGMRTQFVEDSRLYTQTPAVQTGWADSLLGIQADDEMTQRMVDFAEMALDLTVGGLKNNVVQLAQEAGQTCYQINVSQIQFPSLFNAGLSVLAYHMMGQPDPSYLEYEDYYGLFFARYQAATGVAVPQDVQERYAHGDITTAWYEANQDLLTGLDTFASTWSAQYDQWKDTHRGVLYVAADGAAQTYNTVAEFLAAHPERKFSYLEYYLAGDVAVDTVANLFSLDQDGRLTGSQVEVTLTSTDEAGTRHTFQASLDLTFDQYGTTSVPPLDVGGAGAADLIPILSLGLCCASRTVPPGCSCPRGNGVFLRSGEPPGEDFPLF